MKVLAYKKTFQFGVGKVLCTLLMLDILVTVYRRSG